MGLELTEVCLPLLPESRDHRCARRGYQAPLQPELKHPTCQTWVLGTELGPSEGAANARRLRARLWIFEPCKYTFPHIILKEGKGDERGCEPRLGLCPVGEVVYC